MQEYSSCLHFYTCVQTLEKLLPSFEMFSKDLVGRRWCTLVHIFQTISIVTSSKQTRRLFNFYSAIDVAVIPTTISNCCQSIHCWCRIVLNFCMYLRSIALCRTDSDLVETQILLKNLSSIQGEGKNTYIISFKWGDNRGGLFVNVPSICIACSKNTCWSNKTFFFLPLLSIYSPSTYVYVSR